MVERLEDIAKQDPSRYHRLVKRFGALGVASPSQAEAQGYRCIRVGHGPTLWAHQRDLPELEALLAPPTAQGGQKPARRQDVEHALLERAAAIDEYLRADALPYTLREQEGGLLLCHRVPVKIQALGTEFSAVVWHDRPLPDALKEALLGVAPSAGPEVFAATGAPFAPSPEEVSELESRLQALGGELDAAAAQPGISRDSLRYLLSRELKRPITLGRTIERVHTRLASIMERSQEAGALSALLDEDRFRRYAEHFPEARGLGRRLVLFVGPTNSGKTYNALNALAAAGGGIYLAPLRLLALEGQEELEKRGCVTSFVTGEERDIKPGALFQSSTIEMINLSRVVEAAVVDEVQLLADPDRGWAWSAAIIGAPARTVYMTGSPESVPLVQAIAEYLREPLEIRRLERFNPLRVQEAPSRLDQLEPGTAIICFTRRDCLGLKQELEQKHRVAVIYGNLSPQVRREEARRFRSGEADILVATDAIALGLNLPIRTVLFYTVTKWNGREQVPISNPEVRQIGGRAGRYGKADVGYVGAFARANLRRIESALSAPHHQETNTIQVRPSLSHVLALGDSLKTGRLAPLLDLFQKRVRFDDPLLTTADLEEMLALAEICDHYPLALSDKFTFACVPVDTRSETMVGRYKRWLKNFAKGLPSPVETRTFTHAERLDQDELFQAELEVKLLTGYAWLSYRYPEAFPDTERCEAHRSELNAVIERTLRQREIARRCQSCGGPLPALHRFAICESCYQGL